MIEAVDEAVDKLLDREQRNQRAGYRNDEIEIGDWITGRQPERAEAAEIIEIAVPDEAERDGEHDQPCDDLDGQARAAVHRLRDGGEIQVIVAPGRDRGTDEDRVDEHR